MAGAFLANATVFIANRASDGPTVIAASAGIALGNTLEALTGGALARRWIGERNPADRTDDTFKFIAAGLMACLTSSIIGPALHSLGRNRLMEAVFEHCGLRGGSVM
jgi:integral membrane sensor domain MASE1